MNMLQVESRDTTQDRSIGHLFYEERTKQSLTVQTVSDQLKFLPAVIEALENEQWEKLPKGFILRGLVKKYATLLNIDEAYALSLLPAKHTYQPFKSDSGLLDESWLERSAPLLSKCLWGVLVVLLVVLAMVVIGWLTDSSFIDFLHLNTGSTPSEQ